MDVRAVNGHGAGTFALVAAALGIGAGTVKSIGRQALARLRTLAPDLAEHVGDHS